MGKQKSDPTGLHRAAILVILLLLGLAARGFAEKISDLRPQGYVNDFAHVLNGDTTEELSSLCQEVDQKARTQIAIVTVHSLNGTPIDTFANELFTKWGVGYKGADRGVMILLAIADHRYRIEVGYGLEAVLTDGEVGRFGRQVAPALRGGNYDAAVLQLARDVAAVIAQSRGVKLTNGLADAVPNDQRQKPLSPYLPLIIILVIAGIGALSSFGSSFRGPGSRWRGGGWGAGPWMGGGWGGSLGGGGFGGGGGGFGGFGGGMSGGGGASGGW